MGIRYNIIYLNIYFFFRNEAGSVWWGSRSIWGGPVPMPRPGPGSLYFSFALALQ